MIAYANYIAKALVAFAVPVALVTADLASQWLGLTEDGVLDVSETHAFVLAVLTAVGVFLKSNGPKPE